MNVHVLLIFQIKFLIAGNKLQMLLNFTVNEHYSTFDHSLYHSLILRCFNLTCMELNSKILFFFLYKVNNLYVDAKLGKSLN